MKRLVVIISAILLITSCIFPTSAQEVATITVQADDIKTNRQFDISIYIDSSEFISGGQLSITYDNSIVEYRGVSSDIYEVDAKDNGDNIHIVFATAHKVDCSDNIKAITLQFKSISSGEFDVSLNCSECVDYNLNDVSVTTVSGTISVYGSSVKVSSSKEKSSLKGEKSTISAEDETESGLIRASTYISGMNNTTKAALIGIGSGLVVIVLFALGILLGRKTDKSRDIKPDKNEDIEKNKDS